MNLKDGLLQHFEACSINLQTNVFDKCVELCETYNINPEDFVDQWCAFSLPTNTTHNVTLDALNKMERTEIQKHKHHNSLKSTMVEFDHSAIPQEVNALGTPKAVRQQHSRISTPLQKRKILEDSLMSSPGSPNVNYANRTDARTVRCSYGSQTDYKQKSDLSIKPCNFHTDNLKPEARYMHEVLSRKGKVVDNMVEWLAHSIYRKNKDHIMVPYAYGRIVSDSNGKINNQSLLLEGTYTLNEGQNVSLNVAKLPKYSLFPGQVVVLNGCNLNTNLIGAEDIFTDAILDLPKTRPVLTDPINIVVAAGPFTTQDNILYEPLEDLLKYVVEYKPQVLFLMGPFLDHTHKSILKGDLTESVDSFFSKVIEKIMSTLAGINIQVVVVASQREAHHHPVYPTMPYEVREPYSNLTFVPDPCVLDIDGLVVAATTVDILRDISNYEINFDKKSTTAGDRLGRITSHLLQQHSFYPLDPPNKEMGMNNELMEKYGMLDVKPHILILPSNLRYFIKNVENCLVVNPERITKGGCAAGTFARIEVNPGDEPTICNRTSAEILKI